MISTLRERLNIDALLGDSDRDDLVPPWPTAPLMTHERVRLERDNLLFDGEVTFVRPGTRMLQTFASLHDRPHEAFRRFALRWGHLGLCRTHDRPFWHGSSGIADRCLEPPRAADVDFPIEEPMYVWRSMSRRAYDILTVANELTRYWDNDPLPPWPRERGQAPQHYQDLADVSHWAPRRMPRAGERRFCDKLECGGAKGEGVKRGAWKLNKRDQRAGLAKPRKKRGESDADLAARLNAWCRRSGSPPTSASDAE